MKNLILVVVIFSLVFVSCNVNTETEREHIERVEHQKTRVKISFPEDFFQNRSFVIGNRQKQNLLLQIVPPNVDPYFGSLERSIFINQERGSIKFIYPSGKILVYRLAQWKKPELLYSYYIGGFTDSAAKIKFFPKKK